MTIPTKQGEAIQTTTVTQTDKNQQSNKPTFNLRSRQVPKLCTVDVKQVVGTTETSGDSSVESVDQTPLICMVSNTTPQNFMQLPESTMNSYNIDVPQIYNEMEYNGTDADTLHSSTMDLHESQQQGITKKPF